MIYAPSGSNRKRRRKKKMKKKKKRRILSQIHVSLLITTFYTIAYD
jgi:hypothetical protein